MRRAAVISLTVVACLSLPAASLAASRQSAAPAAAPLAPTQAVTVPAPPPPQASAASTSAAEAQNQRSSRAAINAYATYLRSLADAKPIAKQAEQSFTDATSQDGCKGALSPIAAVSSSPPGWSTALTAFGEEIGADATTAFDQTAAAPFAKLVTTLSALRWNGPGLAATVRRYVNAETALLALQPSPSNLCADAWELASQSTAQTMTSSPATLQLLSAYETASAALNLRLGLFLKQLSGFETSADRTVAARVNTLAKRVNTISTSTVASGIASLKLMLGITPPNPRHPSA